MLRIGVICPSEIAYRRFVPSLLKTQKFQYIGVGIASKEEWQINQSIRNSGFFAYNPKSEYEKAKKFVDKYQGKIFNSYKSMLLSKEIDAIYIPLPPSLHYIWARYSLENNLHVFLEKPSTTSLSDTSNLVAIAQSKNLVLHENYMFMFHSQIKTIQDLIKSEVIGKIYLYRLDFGFPHRGNCDFRYNKFLGGGALFDCGGYTLKLADNLLENSAKIVNAKVTMEINREIDIFGVATLTNSKGSIAQVSFGMDNDYRCNIDIWGSSGSIKSNRIFTAPSNFRPTLDLYKNGIKQKINLKSDDAFFNSIMHFYKCTQNNQLRIQNYNQIIRQEKLVENFRNLLS